MWAAVPPNHLIAFPIGDAFHPLEIASEASDPQDLSLRLHEPLTPGIL